VLCALRGLGSSLRQQGLASTGQQRDQSEAARKRACCCQRACLCCLYRRQIEKLELEPHLNTCFRHFILFTLEFNLIDERELAPLRELIDRMVR
jgi:intergrase/recombinase